ncbi:hypothetical protein AV926_14040 [Myroides marinus]|uniref:RHS repeat-associated core domain-containing protein n=1 Tax=Myroides marinus TaxID=703342 RepID=A0A163XBL6_9FLAO|nr:RHS repeat-associated core domain-containing protein [Myroides marinus]KZE77641.1 hypothetical protein AV926_14040 [Myroides marinus]
MLYDYNSRVLRSYTKNYFLGYTQVDTKYSFTGLPLKVTTKHQKDASTALVTVLEEYVYDHAERLLFQTHKVNGLAEVVIFENIYDELGALEKKRIGGKRSTTSITPTANTFLQELQYKYNIRGWLTEVNNASNINQVNNGKSSLFALKLNYNKPEQAITGVKPLYNGNISEQIWTSAIDNKKRGYGYVYDGVNRLVLGSFKAPDLNSASTASLFDEKLEYDKNGNILKLDRNGASLAGVTTLIDKLTYGYESGSNRLSTVRDASGNQEGFKQVNTAGADYAYDEFGNLISDKHKKITKIKYNHLNLPVEINFGTDKIEYLYTASGEKTQKKVTEKGVVTLTDYLGGFQYVKGKLSFLPTAEGFFNAETNAYVYQYKDHLGNVRLSYSDKSGDNTIQSSTEIIEEINYYPFGLAHKGYNQKNDALMKDYKYQYNGKEKQEELGLNLYDYGARNYDAAISRWMNVDPLAEKIPNYNPYIYTYNNPIRFTDPTGMIGEDFVQRKDGSIYWDNNANNQASTKAEETYLGKNLSFTFNSFIADNYDGPLGSFPEGDKLTTTINVSATENSAGELTGLSATKTTEIGNTFGFSLLKGRDYYSGEGGSNNYFTQSQWSINYEQHASVPGIEGLGLKSMGYQVVDVAQKLNISFDKASGNLSVSAYTNTFPSATLKLNNTNTMLMNYRQPSFIGTHTAPIKGYSPSARGEGRTGGQPIRDLSYYPSKFYKRN